MLGLGGYPLVSLAEARNVAFVNRQRARAGGDPLAEKGHGQGVPTVKEAAAAVLAQQRPGWRNAKYGLAAQSARLCVPAYRALPVSALTTADMLSITGRTRASATVGWQRRSWISNHACVR